MVIQQRIHGDKQPVTYSRGAYNKVKGDEQWIRLSEGCPWNHPYCYEPTEIKIYEIPEIIRNKVGIMDMNLLCKPEAVDIIKKLSAVRVDKRKVRYDILCGIDYRFLTPEIALLLKKGLRLKKVRLAWDWWYKDQYKIWDAVDILVKAGFTTGKRCNIMVFMICNWKISYQECCDKLDILKIWGVQVADCWYDNQTPPKITPLHWSAGQITKFRKKCRKHNQLVGHGGLDPELRYYKSSNPLNTSK